MASFRETREMLSISHAMDFITDAEFLLPYEESKSDNLDFPYQEYPTFSLPDKSRANCTANFKVEKHHITSLALKMHCKFLLYLNSQTRGFYRDCSVLFLPFCIVLTRF